MATVEIQSNPIQSAGELDRKLPAAQRLPLAGEQRDQPLPAVAPWHKDAPLHLALTASHAPWGRSLRAGRGEVVHGEVAEQVRTRQVVKHQGQGLGVRLVAQQNPVQVPDPSGLTQLVAPSAGQEDSMM